MMRLLATAAVVMLASTAQAAGLPQLRTEVAAADSRVAGAKAQRAGLQRSLDEVARQIEARKASRGNALFGDAELDRLLKRSQELSSQLTDALKAENDAEELLRGGQSKMVNELDGELARLRGKWDAAKTREERQALVQQLKSLRAEREALRRSMPATLVPSVSDRPTDDPDELLERADALLDGEDKLRREEKALEKRIADLKAERDLERRMNEFLSEDALFDEHDRRLSVTRPGAKAAAAGIDYPASPAGDANKSAPEAAVPSAQAPGEMSAGTNGDPTAAMNDGRAAPPPSYSDSDSLKGAGTPTGGAGTLGRQDGAEAVAAPRVDVTKAPPERRTGIAPYSEDESLEQLIARRKQIKKIADEMHQKASEAVERANTLK